MEISDNNRLSRRHFCRLALGLMGGAALEDYVKRHGHMPGESSSKAQPLTSDKKALASLSQNQPEKI